MICFGISKIYENSQEQDTRVAQMLQQLLQKSVRAAKFIGLLEFPGKCVKYAVRVREWEICHGIIVGMSKHLIKKRGKGEFTKNMWNYEYDILAECGVNPVVV